MRNRSFRCVGCSPPREAQSATMRPLGNLQALGIPDTHPLAGIERGIRARNSSDLPVYWIRREKNRFRSKAQFEELVA